MLKKMLKGMTVDDDVLCVHVMAFDLLRLHGFEGSGAYMQRHLIADDAMSVDIFQHAVGEMQSCCRCCHTAFDLGVDGLVSGLVALLRLAVEIRRDGQFTHRLKNVGKVDLIIVPLKVNPIVRTAALLRGTAAVHRGVEGELMTFDLKVAVKRTLFPLLQIADHAQPAALSGRLKHLLVIGGLGRLHEEDLDERTGLLAEVHTRLDDAGVVEHHQRTGRKMLWQVVENIFADRTMVVDKQFAVVAFLQRELSNTTVG